MLRRALIFAALLTAARVSADSWSLPRARTYSSENGQWRLTVIPKELRSQLEYFEDKVAGVDNAGAVNTIAARGELFRKTGGGTWDRVGRWPLVNEVAPVSALVANDGTTVTFDNWHSMGYGDDVVVIYRSDGSLVRKLGLTDLLEVEDIDQLTHSVSSIWWSGTHRLDEKKRILLLEVSASKIEVLPISLDTGMMLVPKRYLYPRPRTTWAPEKPSTANCAGAIALSAAQLQTDAVTAEAPVYPTVARKARISGLVIMDLRIAPNGKVESAAMVKALPFGLDQAAHDAVMQWRFRSTESDEQPQSRCGRVSIKYDLGRTGRAQ